MRWPATTRVPPNWLHLTCSNGCTRRPTWRAQGPRANRPRWSCAAHELRLPRSRGVERARAGRPVPRPPRRTQTMMPERRMRRGMPAEQARADGLLASELGAVQVCVQSLRREQLVVLATFADPALVDDQDLVGLTDGR